MALQQWHLICTKPGKEKKACAYLTKKGIEAYSPFISTLEKNRKINECPLLKSYVFIHLTDEDKKTIHKTPGFLNFVYWKTSPAIINSKEIDIIKSLILNYSHIHIEKAEVNSTTNDVKFLQDPNVLYQENTVSIKFNKVKVLLPSLGCIITAQQLVNETSFEVISANKQNTVGLEKSAVFVFR